MDKLGTYNIKVKAKDSNGATSVWSDLKTINIMIQNEEPDEPNILSGPINGTIGISYTYSTITIDPDDDKIIYGWDWDGDSIPDDWSEPVTSGLTDFRSHSWNIAGIYNIKVIAKDEHGAQSGWSKILSVIISGGDHPPFLPPKWIKILMNLTNVHETWEEDHWQVSIPFNTNYILKLIKA